MHIKLKTSLQQFASVYGNVRVLEIFCAVLHVIYRTAGEKNIHYKDFTCAPFRFLQLLCEDPNLGTVWNSVLLSSIAICWESIAIWNSMHKATHKPVHFRKYIKVKFKTCRIAVQFPPGDLSNTRCFSVASTKIEFSFSVDYILLQKWLSLAKSHSATDCNVNITALLILLCKFLKCELFELFFLPFA